MRNGSPFTIEPEDGLASPTPDPALSLSSPCMPEPTADGEPEPATTDEPSPHGATEPWFAEQPELHMTSFSMAEGELVEDLGLFEVFDSDQVDLWADLPPLPPIFIEVD
ncbi:Protein Daple [Labeo rohita]|uniref:Protein Daple n=1 Tax=Labeo rohita TaxID=84645 RepID=A0ABQ8LPX7_LABRO|nr:Protein Daple [Labeo rohita]